MTLLFPACECHEEGSVGKTCEDLTGKCTCKDNEGYSGLKCNEPADGYYDMPPKGN